MSAETLRPDEAERLVSAIEEGSKHHPARLSQTLPVECWTYTADADDVPATLRLIADHLERPNVALLGLQSTGFGESWQAVLQVFVDVYDSPPTASDDGPAESVEQP